MGGGELPGLFLRRGLFKNTFFFFFFFFSLQIHNLSYIFVPRVNACARIYDSVCMGKLHLMRAL